MLRILLLAVFLLGSCNVQPEAELVAFGDSVSWGYGDLPGGWVRRLEEKSGYEISNLAVPGEYTIAAADRIGPALRTAPNAKTVFVLHGGNDWILAWRSNWCKQGCEPSAVDNKYVAIGDRLRRIRSEIDARGKKTVFLTYWPDANAACAKYDPATFAQYQRHRQRLNQEIATIAGEHGDHVVHLDDLQGFDLRANFYDCLHPSPQGYRIIADRMLDDISDWEPPTPSPKDLLKIKPRL